MRGETELRRTIDSRKRLTVWIPSGTVVLDLGGWKNDLGPPTALAIGDAGVFVDIALEELATLGEDPDA